MSVVKMTEGKILSPLFSYSLSLVLGNLFQLAYNAVDSIIVGRFIGKEALAAVGTASPVMNIVILGISGICIGSSVLMSNFFGAGREDLLRKEMATTSVFGLIFSISVALIGAILTPLIVKALQVPEDIQHITITYLRIVFFGSPFTYFYNALSSAMKSVGDSKTPLKFLAFSSVLNMGLDIILIGYFGFGIVTCAVTTIVAQGASAILCIIYVYKKIPILSLSAREFRIDGPLLKKTLSFGGVTALQQSVQPICKLLIQGAINTLGVDVMAAFNAVTRVDDFAYTPEQSIAQGITTFVAQNEGAGKKERVIKGFRSGLFLEVSYWVLICVISFSFRYKIMGLFIADSSSPMIEEGASYLALMAFLYIFPAFTNGIQGFFRGLGKMKITLLCTTIQAGLRVIFVYILIGRLGIESVAISSMIGWIAMLLVEVPLYFKYKKHSVAK